MSATRYYHISPARNRESIEREGLRAASPDMVWLLPNLADALRLRGKSWDCSTVNDVWVVEVAGLDVLPDPHAGWPGVVSKVVRGPVPPARLALGIPA